MAAFSQSRLIVASLVLLVLAALVFAAWPRAHKEASVSSASGSPVAVSSASSGTSTFGGAISKNRPDIRASGLYTAPVSGN